MYPVSFPCGSLHEIQIIKRGKIIQKSRKKLLKSFLNDKGSSSKYCK